MQSQLSVDLDKGVIVVRYDGIPSDDMADAYLEQYTELVRRGVPYTSVFSSLPDARLPSAAQLRKQAAWVKEHRQITREYCRGLAFALRSPAMRGVLRALLTMQPFSAEHVVLRDEAEAIAWAKARLS